MSVKMAGQTINDRLLAARHSIAGQGLAKSVCKATTEEMIGPKKKHLDYLIHCTNEPNVSIPQLANLLVERSQNASWVVVFKALITVHHMLCYGNERFTQYLASSNSTFQLSNFLDKSGVQGYDMSPFIRRYAKYLNEKALSYRTVAFDLCKVKRGKEDGTLRTMPADKLLKTLPVLQAQLDALLEFDCSPNDLSNGVISMAFMLLFRDLIRLFACYNDGIINLLEKYFDMNKKQCRDALDLYKKFLIRMDRVAEFLKVAENVGIDKGDIPDLTKAPSSLLDALEQHLATLEGKKGSQANTPTQSASHRTNVKSGVSVLSSTSSAFTTAAASNGIDDNLRQQALAEEAAAMSQYKAKVSSPVGASTNPFLASPTRAAPANAASSNTAAIVDLFSAPAGVAAPEPAKASDDLLQLAGSNPFADIWPNGGASFVPDDAFNCVFGNESNVTPAAQGIPQTTPNPFETPSTGAGVAEDLFALDSMPAGKGAPPRPPPPSAATNSPARSALDDLNDSIRMALGGTSPAPGSSPAKQPLGVGPQSTTGQVGAPPPSSSAGSGLGLAGFGEVLAPSHSSGGVGVGPLHPSNMAQAPLHEPATSKVLTGDLEASLASLAENLTINKSATSNQWSSPKNTARPGWTPQPMAATTGVGYRPMGMAAMQPMAATGMMRPAMSGAGVQQQQPTIATGGGVLRPTNATAQPASAAAAAAALDPFGAL